MADILVIDDQDRTFDLCRRAIPEHRYRGPARSFREASELLARARGRVERQLVAQVLVYADRRLVSPAPANVTIYRLTKKKNIAFKETISCFNE